MALKPKARLRRREKRPYWYLKEKVALFRLVKTHIDIIENKKLDAETSALKSITWNKILFAFRRKFTTKRDVDKIKSQWERMKEESKIAMHGFAARGKLLGPEVAAKKMPSSLLIDVWQLLLTVNGNNCDSGETSLKTADESSQDVECVDIDAVLDKVPSADEPEVANMIEIKMEPPWDGYEEDPLETNNIDRAQSPVEGLVEKKSILVDKGETTNTVDKEKIVELWAPQNHEDSGKEENPVTEDTMENLINQEDMSIFESSVDNAVWPAEATQRKLKLKIRKLNTDLERAELRKQVAVNKLQTVEIKKKLSEIRAAEYYSRMRMSGEAGSGAGRGGGGGGTIRSAGGSFGKMEAAHEDQYFYNQQKEQLKHLREELHDEISFHEEQIKRHQEAINRHKDRIGKMAKE